jgi:probable rRNA maturation factor
VNIVLDGFEILSSPQKEELENVVYSVLNTSDLKGYSVSISLVNKSVMKDLCLRFKNKKKVTDVLSFPLPKMERQFAHTKNLLGDVVICLEQAQEQASSLGHSLKEEVAVLCAHGLLHLLGYDHEQSDEEANIQMQGEMYLLEKAGLSPELSLIGRV